MATVIGRAGVPVSEPMGTALASAGATRRAAPPGTRSAPSHRRWRPGPGSFFARLGIGLGLLVIVLSLGAPLLAPHDPLLVDLHTGLQPPSGQHWLGTDALGRDVWSRLLWAGQTSLSVAAVIVVLTLTVGLGLGLVAGYCGGVLDDLAMRLTDLCAALPSLIVTLALIGVLGPSLPTLILALSLTGWTFYARLTRSLVLRTCTQEFVLAAHALGATPCRIALRHVLPAVWAPVAVQLSLNVGGIVLSLAGLSFLGLGIQPPTPEWGAMLVDARPFLASAPHLVVPPGLAIFLLVFGCNALAESLAHRHSPSGAMA
jgi:ABC-type dipeptide/oligopeptide/nickel transport system permease subunit